MNSQLSLEHVRIPSTTTTSGPSKTSDVRTVTCLTSDTCTIDSSSNSQQGCHSHAAPIHSNFYDVSHACDCQSSIKQDHSGMQSNPISTDPPQNDLDDVRQTEHASSHHSPLHLVEKGMCTQHGRSECGTVLQGNEMEKVAHSSSMSDIPDCKGGSSVRTTVKNHILESKATDAIRGETFKDSLGDHSNENKCILNRKVDDASENLTKSPPPRQVSESSSSSSAESKMSLLARKNDGEVKQNGTVQDSKEKSFEAVESASNSDLCPNLPLSFSIDVSSALDHVLHEYERDKIAHANVDSNVNTTCTGSSGSVRRIRPCVLQQSSVVDICSGSTSPSGDASLDESSAMPSSKIGDKSFSEPPSISVKSSMLICEESLNRIAQMTAPSKCEPKQSEVGLSNALSTAACPRLNTGAGMHVSSMITGTKAIRTPAKNIQPLRRGLASNESKAKVPLITGTAAAKFESMRRRSETKESPLISESLSPKPLSPPPVLVSGMSKTKTPEDDRAKINAAIARASELNTSKTEINRNNQRGIDILADITSHAVPISNNVSVSSATEEETIVPVGQSLSVYSAIAAQAGVATRQLVYVQSSKPQEEIKKSNESQSVQVKSDAPKARNISVREIGKIRRYCAAKGEFSTWEDLPCQTYGDTDPRRWCELNIDESIEIPLRRGGRLRVFPNFVADGRRDKVARSMDKCTLYRQYWRHGVENTLESRIQVFLSSKTNRVHNGSSKRGRPGYIYDGVTMMAQPISRVPEVESLGRDLAELYRLPDKEWNIGTNLVCYRTGEDHMAWNSNCEQGEVLILCIITESKNCTRPILIRPKGHLPLQDGDEEIIVFVGQGDAYEMDGKLQIVIVLNHFVAIGSGF
jgi:hypothetical protein